MDLGNSMAFVFYKFYNWLAIHNAPECILDCFMLVLCESENRLKELFFKEEYLTEEIRKEIELWDRID